MLKAVCNFKKSKKGFTLIELLIVVAIIAILAAIAIPQFSQYRVRGFNSAAGSDIRNIKVQVEAFNTDWQVYASSKANGTPGDGVIKDGPSNVGVPVVAGTIVVASPGLPTADVTFNFGISSGVRAFISTGANGANYAAETKHTSGDREYAADSDNTEIKWKSLAAGTRLDTVVSSDGTDNFTAVGWAAM